MSEKRPGVRLGVDVGSVRVGVAISDPDGILATPLVTLDRDAAGERDVIELVRLTHEHDVVEVIIGLPVGLNGRDGAAAAIARAYAALVATAIAPVPVRLADERLTTVSAERLLRGRGLRGPARRKVVDQAAAVVILQAALDTDRAGRRSFE